MYTLPQQDLAHVWEKTKDCLPSLHGSRFFITGGTGFFGRWLLESILYANQYFNADIRAVVLTRNPSDFLKNNPPMARAACFEFLKGDVCDFTFPSGNFSHVIHAATEASAALNQEQPLVMFDTITKGTRRVLEFAVQANVKNFLLTSSGAVYGRQPAQLTHVPETFCHAPDPLISSSAYGIGKLTAEHLCLLFYKQFGLPIKIARCFAFVGPYLPLDIHFAIGNFIAHALKQEAIQISGDGSPFRSYLYMADLTAWLWKILCDGAAGQAYNVGSDDAVSIAELAHLIATEVQPKLPVNIAKSRDPNRHPERYVPNIDKAKNELNLSQWISLPEAIRRTITWNQSYAKS